MAALPLPDRLDGDDFYEAIGGAQRYDRLLELDYELCRIAWLNCGAWERRKPPKWVLKGGFAIRHTYRSERVSADVDLAPVGLSGRGTGALVLPPELRPARVKVAKSGKSERHEYDFPLIVGSDQATIWADLNTLRPVRLPPPDVRTFTSPFLPDFPVWVTSIEEIIGEKAAGLLSFQDGDIDRIKDAFDLWFLLKNRHAATLRQAELRRVLDQLYVREGVRCPTTGLGVWFREVLNAAGAERRWNQVVRPILRGAGATPFATVRKELPTLAQRYLV